MTDLEWGPKAVCIKPCCKQQLCMVAHSRQECAHLAAGGAVHCSQPAPASLRLPSQTRTGAQQLSAASPAASSSNLLWQGGFHPPGSRPPCLSYTASPCRKMPGPPLDTTSPGPAGYEAGCCLGADLQSLHMKAFRALMMASAGVIWIAS